MTYLPWDGRSVVQDSQTRSCCNSSEQHEGSACARRPLLRPSYQVLHMCQFLRPAELQGGLHPLPLLLFSLVGSGTDPACVPGFTENPLYILMSWKINQKAVGVLAVSGVWLHRDHTHSCCRTSCISFLL